MILLGSVCALAQAELQVSPGQQELDTQLLTEWLGGPRAKCAPELLRDALISADEAKQLIDAAEAIAQSRGGWASTRHVSYQTHDLALADIWAQPQHAHLEPIVTRLVRVAPRTRRRTTHTL